MRNSVVFYINGLRHEVSGKNAFCTLSDFLRYEADLPGTKVVCSEGDCGACTALLSRYHCDDLLDFKSINTCITFVYSLDQCHLITVEGLKGKSGLLHPAQTAMIEQFGAQCGFCTPGFICALAECADQSKKSGRAPSEKKVKNYLTGNLCRCTGYDAIVKAGVSMKLSECLPLHELYPEQEMKKEFKALCSLDLKVEHEGKLAFLPAGFDSALQFKSNHSTLKMISGSTDLGVLHNKGKWEADKILSLARVHDAYQVIETEHEFQIGARASLHEVIAKLSHFYPDFVSSMNVFASPQIKNSGTLVGNLMNASPIADSIPFLYALNAKVVCESVQARREVPLWDFIKPGYKQLDIQPNELVTAVKLPKIASKFKVYKVSNRKDLDISVVNAVFRYVIEDKRFKELICVYGGVAASVVRLTEIEQALMGQTISLSLFQRAASLMPKLIAPISDVRGSKEYRLLLAKNLLLKFYSELETEGAHVS